MRDREMGMRYWSEREYWEAGPCRGTKERSSGREFY